MIALVPGRIRSSSSGRSLWNSGEPRSKTFPGNTNMHKDENSMPVLGSSTQSVRREKSMLPRRWKWSHAPVPKKRTIRGGPSKAMNIKVIRRFSYICERVSFPEPVISVYQQAVLPTRLKVGRPVTVCVSCDQRHASIQVTIGLTGSIRHPLTFGGDIHMPIL